MAWSIEHDPGALKDLKKLDRAIQREILDFMDTRVAMAEDPRHFGKPLRASKFGLWRYRVRDYRIICELQKKRLVVLVEAPSLFTACRMYPYTGTSKKPTRQIAHRRGSRERPPIILARVVNAETP